MRALDLKLLREVRRHWIQIASIALVMGCGTMTIMGLRSTLTSIREARDTYYAEYRFADVFARVERAPIAPRVLEEARLARLEAEENLRVARERSRAAEADARQTRAALAGQESAASMRTVVRSPAGGRVLRIPERSERIVTAGTTLLELGDPGSLEIVVEVLSSDAGMVHSGDRVRIAEWMGAAVEEATQRLDGRVREIEPSAFTKVSALGVEEQHDGRIQTRSVRIGHTGAHLAEVLGGVQPGDRIVVFPSDRLSPGVRVKVRQQSAHSNGITG